MLYILVGTFIGTVIGIYFLTSFASDTLKIVFGIAVILFSLKMLLEKYFSIKKIKSQFGILFGGLGGITGGMFSTNGPPITLYLGHQIINKQTLRGTLVAIFLIDSVWRNGLYFFMGMFNSAMLNIVLFMIPVLIITTVIGSKIHLKLSEDFYRKLVAVILLISGILLVI